MIYERLVWEGMPFAAQRTNSKSADKTDIGLFALADAAFSRRCSESLLAVQRIFPDQSFGDARTGQFQTTHTQHRGSSIKL